MNSCCLICRIERCRWPGRAAVQGLALPAFIVVGLLFAVSILLASGPLNAQTRAGEDADDAPAANQRAVIRFVTSDDYPPFNSRDEDGVLTGLNIDLGPRHLSRPRCHL